MIFTTYCVSGRNCSFYKLKQQEPEFFTFPSWLFCNVLSFKERGLYRAVLVHRLTLPYFSCPALCILGESYSTTRRTTREKYSSLTRCFTGSHNAQNASLLSPLTTETTIAQSENTPLSYAQTHFGNVVDMAGFSNTSPEREEVECFSRPR